MRTINAFLAVAMVCVVRLAGAAEPNCPAPADPGSNYFVVSQVDLMALIGPPPAADSPQQQADLQGVLSAQRAARAAGTTARAIADSEMTCARFRDVLGDELKSPAADSAIKFISRAASSAGLVTNPPKGYWKRPRPYVVSKEVETLADSAPDGSMASTEYPVDPKCARPEPKDAQEAKRRAEQKERNRLQKDNTSYPSGHAAYGMACAILLAGVVPEKRAELFARGRQYGESRLVIGAHFPSDVEAGRTIAVAGMTLLMENARFQRQYYEATSELRAALKLPAKQPDLEPRKGLFPREAPRRASDEGGPGGGGVGPNATP